MNEKDIGANIRKLRKQKKLTLTSVAGQAKLTKGNLSKIETGQISPPISTLLRIADVLGMPLASFFAEPQTSPRYVLTRGGEGQIVARDGARFGYTYEALAMGMPDKRTEPFILTIKPEDTPGEFQHGGEEFIYMLSGRMELTIDKEKLILRKGDSIYFDPRYPHTNRVLGKQVVRYVCVFTQEERNDEET